MGSANKRNRNSFHRAFTFCPAGVKFGEWWQSLFEKKQWPLLVTQSETYRPVMVGLQYFFQLNTPWGEVMAYRTIITLPVLIFYLCPQRLFISSIAASGIKG
ncbi:hypothetical protein [Agrobacterium sp. NPDC090283]|uniref:hypothetical protein n=1 Tax=Agrobacterium sp. NPDC090283 TaxID=3363920 RepID=UPI00383A43F0